MDPEQKKAALREADQKIATAQAALETANTALETAKGENDESKITAAQDAVTKAQKSVKDAQDAKTDIEAGDIIDDANRPPRLNDGTPGDKDIKVSKEKFDELNEQAKLFQQFAPVLSKLRDNPQILDRIMAGDDPSKDLPARMAAIESKLAEEKKTEIKSVITDAVKAWPDFREKWDEIKPIVQGLQATGVPYRDAVQRAYFAVNPDATKKATRIAEQADAADRERRRGEMSAPGGGGGPIEEPDQDEYQLSDADRDFATKAGIDPKLYTKHKGYIDRFKDF